MHLDPLTTICRLYLFFHPEFVEGSFEGYKRAEILRQAQNDSIRKPRHVVCRELNSEPSKTTYMKFKIPEIALLD